MYRPQTYEQYCIYDLLSLEVLQCLYKTVDNKAFIATTALETLADNQIPKCFFIRVNKATLHISEDCWNPLTGLL